MIMAMADTMENIHGTQKRDERMKIHDKYEFLMS